MLIQKIINQIRSFNQQNFNNILGLCRVIHNGKFEISLVSIFIRFLLIHLKIFEFLVYLIIHTFATIYTPYVQIIIYRWHNKQMIGQSTNKHTECLTKKILKLHKNELNQHQEINTQDDLQSQDLSEQQIQFIKLQARLTHCHCKPIRRIMNRLKIDRRSCKKNRHNKIKHERQEKYQELNKLSRQSSNSALIEQQNSSLSEFFNGEYEESYYYDQFGSKIYYPYLYWDEQYQSQKQQQQQQWWQWSYFEPKQEAMFMADCRFYGIDYWSLCRWGWA